MAFTRITTSDTNGKGVIGLPDVPGLSTQEMQERFDEIALEVIIPKFNALLGELEGESAAASLGAALPSGISAAKNVQSVMNAIAAVAASAVLNAQSAAEQAAAAAKQATQAAADAATSAEGIDEAIAIASNANAKIDAAIELINSITYMIDPVTGETVLITQAIQNIYNAMLPAPITAGEYDALQLTAEEYDNYNITAHDYDFYAAQILGK